MTEIRSPDGGAQSSDTDSRDRAAPSDNREWSYDDWWDQLDGLPSSLPASRVSFGRYAKRDASGGHYGIAIYPDADQQPWVRIGRKEPFPLGDAAAEEDLSYNTIAGSMPVPQEAYDAWFRTGTWPEGTVLDRPRPKVERAKPAAAEDSQPAEKQPAVFVRLYRTIDPPKSSMTFMARAIARTKSGAEGFSVGFYADTEAGARKMAEIWIAEERAKADRAEAARQSRAERMRRPGATTEQPASEGASA